MKKPKNNLADSRKARKLPRYLFQNEHGYHARMVVPEPLRHIVGQSEFWKPVHADSDARAIRKLPGIVAPWHAAIDAARAQVRTTQPPRQGRALSPAALAVAHYGDQVALDTELRNTDSRFAAGFIDADYVGRLRRIVNGAATNDECRDAVGWIDRKYRAAGNLKAKADTPEWREAMRALAVAELESLSRTAERDEGDFSGAPSDPLLTAKPEAVAPKDDPLAARVLCDDSRKTLGEIVADFTRERKASPQTAYEAARTAQLFEECLGEAKPIYKIIRQDVHSFKRMLSELPANASKRFHGLSAPEAIKANKARLTPYPTLDPRTINDGYLTKLRSIFSWCVRSDILPDNPCSAVRIEAAKPTEPPRVKFGPGDLAKIFSAERYDATKPFNESQWAELLSLFTGARASELGQAKLDSVRHQRGVLVIGIEEKTKTAGSRRVVPIHSTLIALGFEKHVAKLRKSGATHLFPEWHRQAVEAKASARSKSTLHYERYIPRRFNVTILKNVGIDDSRKTWHSFRHTLKSALSDAGVQRDLSDAITGHKDGSAGAGYIHGAPIEAMRDAIERVQFDGFTLI